MKILLNEPNQFICDFNGHSFDLSRDSNEAKWYMQVTAPSGSYACDGWIPNSQGISIKEAMIEACDGAQIEPPKYWKDIK